ncbi:MAG: hypothetical protein KA752_09385 [Giesbergeria sp.]|nr:hypothetical protein [Giesbergeria sp.]
MVLVSALFNQTDNRLPLSPMAGAAAVGAGRMNAALGEWDEQMGKPEACLRCWPPSRPSPSGEGEKQNTGKNKLQRLSSKR